jgi:hypothetical protein
MQSRAEIYRRKAQECDALAACTNDHAAREQLRITATRWREMAKQVERLDRLGDARPES